jgi:hypothetical protein
MSLEMILKRAVTHLTSFKLRKAPNEVARQCTQPRRGNQYSVMQDPLSLGEQIERYAAWASELLLGIHDQCIELFTRIQVTSSLENIGLISGEHLDGVLELHRESAEIRTKLGCITEAPCLLEKIEATLDKLCICENNLSRQRNLRRASQIERFVDCFIAPVQDGNLSQASPDVNRCRRPIKGSEIVFEDYIDVSHAADLIFKLCTSFAAILYDLDRLVKTSQQVIEPL